MTSVIALCVRVTACHGVHHSTVCATHKESKYHNFSCKKFIPSMDFMQTTSLCTPAMRQLRMIFVMHDLVVNGVLFPQTVRLNMTCESNVFAPVP